LQPDGSLDRLFPLRTYHFGGEDSLLIESTMIGGPFRFLSDGRVLAGVRLRLGDSYSLVRLNLDDTDKPGVELRLLVDPRFSDATLQFWESSGSATATVSRLGAMSNSLSVAFMTRDGTAAGGQDYMAQNTNFTFAPSETSRTVSVPILDDSIPEQDEYFTVVVTTGANKPTAASKATVLILDDEPGYFTRPPTLYPLYGDGDGVGPWLHFNARPGERWHIEVFPLAQASWTW
jgi:hypothetical protein